MSKKTKQNSSISRTEKANPLTVRKVEPGIYLADFGRAAYAQLEIELESSCGGEEVKLTIAEAYDKLLGQIDLLPSRSCTLMHHTITLLPGRHLYRFYIPPEKDEKPIKSPVDTEIAPFRYLEIYGYHGKLQSSEIIRTAYFTPCDGTESEFESSNNMLNQIWELCKYTMKATGCFGIFIDGNRERVPYEGDAYINQLGHFCCIGDGEIAARTIDYFRENGQWPFEYALLIPQLAWDYHMYNDDSAKLAEWYPMIQDRVLLALIAPSGLLEAPFIKEKFSLEQLMKITGTTRHLASHFREMVDWPPCERDDYDFRDCTFVSNAYFCNSLKKAALIADVLGKKSDAASYREHAEKVRNTLRKTTFNSETGLFADGIGAKHTAIMTAIMAIVFGIAEKAEISKHADFIVSRGMRCSVYGAQFLLEALYRCGRDNDALRLMATDCGIRSWSNMIRQGTTITLESWDRYFQPSQDWNHAWGAAPANIIPRNLFGIVPLEPGFKKFSLNIQPGNLKHGYLKHPTKYGDIIVSFKTGKKGISVDLEVPRGTECLIGGTRTTRGKTNFILPK